MAERAEGLVIGTSAHDANAIGITDQHRRKLYVDYDGNGPQAQALLI